MPFALPQPPFTIPPATRDENAPHGPPIRCDNPPPEMKRIMRLANMRLDNTRLRTGLVTPADLAFEIGGYR